MGYGYETDSPNERQRGQGVWAIGIGTGRLLAGGESLTESPTWQVLSGRSGERPAVLSLE